MSEWKKRSAKTSKKQWGSGLALQHFSEVLGFELKKENDELSAFSFQQSAKRVKKNQSTISPVNSNE